MIFDFETRRFQPCPECLAPRLEVDPDCWRCGGVAFVEPYDPFEPTYSVRIYAAVYESSGGRGGVGGRELSRMRSVVRTHEPEVQLP